MSLRFPVTLLCVVAIAGCAQLLQRRAAVVHPAPLIERAKLLANSGRQFTRISPDGQWLSWLAPYEGVMNLWIAPTAAPESATVLTREKTDPVSRPVWSPDSGSLLFT